MPFGRLGLLQIKHFLASDRLLARLCPVGGPPRRKFPPSFCTRRLFLRNRTATKHTSDAKIAKRIIWKIEHHGFFVKVFHANDAIEMLVVSLNHNGLYIARFNDGVGTNQDCRAA